MLEVAISRIKTSLQEELEKNPDVLERLIGMVDAVAAEAKEKQ